jgi:hypothetical protein
MLNASGDMVVVKEYAVAQLCSNKRMFAQL